MRSTLTLAGALLAVAACGPKATTPAAPANEGGTTATPARGPGTSGFETLSWGDTADQILADFPTGETDGEAVTIVTTYQGHPVVVTAYLEGGGLRSVQAAVGDGYASMQACGDDFASLRAAMDGVLGRSQEDNLAAYWTTATAAVQASCDPVDDDGRAEMSISFAPPEPEE
ncbi:MAG: hypothetical protein H6708_34810 [Kofleriaceae bacterium]|nr:hypothetical protein [Kofleriaceae bacterium]MCB9565586.1 hypothetical protein [Kofleriaceae bacterium]